MQAIESTEPTPRKRRAQAATVETPKPKKEQLVDLLRAKAGVTVGQLSETLGWQPHTVRAALTGLRKANIAIEKMAGRDGEPTRHREWRDTVLLSPRERVEIAFVADNPGAWMIHCHVLDHQNGGMMAMFEVA